MEKKALNSVIKATNQIIQILNMDVNQAIEHILSKKTQKESDKGVYEYLTDDLLKML